MVINTRPVSAFYQRNIYCKNEKCCQFPFKMQYINISEHSYYSVYSRPYFKDDFYSKIPTKNFFYFLPICSLKYA